MEQQQDLSLEDVMFLPGDSEAFQKVFRDGTLQSIFFIPLLSVIVCMEFLSFSSLFGKKIVFFGGETRKKHLFGFVSQVEG